MQPPLQPRLVARLWFCARLELRLEISDQHCHEGVTTASASAERGIEFGCACAREPEPELWP